MKARTIAILALVCAAVAFVGPTSAFEATSFSRSASAAVVSDASGYTALVANACNVLRATGGTCTFTITNKATTPQTYSITLESGAPSGMTYAVGGSSSVSSGKVTATAETGVGSAATATLTLALCPLCASGTAYFTVEGEKSGVLNSIETKFAFPYTYT